MLFVLKDISNTITLDPYCHSKLLPVTVTSELFRKLKSVPINTTSSLCS